jgi:hypothetical protein
MNWSIFQFFLFGPARDGKHRGFGSFCCFRIEGCKDFQSPFPNLDHLVILSSSILSMESPSKRKSSEGGNTLTPSPSVKRSRASPAISSESFTPIIDTEESNGIDNSGVIGRNVDDSFSKSPILATVDEFDTIPTSATFHVQPKATPSDHTPGNVRNGLFGDTSVNSQNQLRYRVPQSRVDTTYGKDIPSSRASAASVVRDVDDDRPPITLMQQKNLLHVEEGSDRYAFKNVLLAAFCAIALVSLTYASYLLLGGKDLPSRS